MENSTKLSAKQVWLYAVGDFGYNFVWTLVSSFLLYFWTDSLKISAAFAGTVMLVSRIWDAVNDPLVGQWADNTKSKKGHYRPWILYAAVPLAVMNVICFTNPGFESEGARTAWALITFFSSVLISTMFYVPFTAMLAALTTDSESRTRATSARLMCAYIAAILITNFTTKLVAIFGAGDTSKGYFFTAVCYSILGVICWMVCYKNTKEVVEVKTEKISWKESFKLLAHNKYTWILAFAFVSYGLFNYGRSATAVYYFTYVAGDASKYGLYGLVHFGMSFVGAFAMPYLAKKAANKGAVPRYAYLITGCCLLIQFFIDPAKGGGLGMLLGIQAVASFFAGVSSSMLYGMIPDVVDYTQFVHNKRAAGFISAIVNFCLKLGMAFGVALVGWLLAATGYVAGAEQSASTIIGLKSLFSIIPGVFALCAFLFLCFYRLDKKTLADMQVKIGLTGTAGANTAAAE